MNYIESVEILGFWGDRNVRMNFRDDVNFLIGPNGSGKTTIINLIAAALKADMPALYSVKFNSIVIKLKQLAPTKSRSLKYQKASTIIWEVSIYATISKSDQVKKALFLASKALSMSEYIRVKLL